MLSHSFRASTRGLVRAAGQQTFSARRTFIATSIRSADFVQDMYLRELKAYKVPPVKATDAEGHVQKFTTPKTPNSPEESDLAKDLQSYESAQVEVEGQSGGDGGEATGASELQNWFEELDHHIEDDPKQGVHH